MITGQLPGTGGRLRATPHHFIVEELPAFELSGKGSHAYVRLTRIGQTTRQLIEEVARLVGCDAGSIGYGGLKDKDAVVTQTISVYAPQRDTEALGRLIADGTGAQVEEVRRHDHKLKAGRVGGNRFTITVTDPTTDALARLADKVSVLQRFGIPNYFGEQRFGHDAANVERGLRVLRGKERAEPWLQKLWVSALQSELFNAWLAIRIQSGLFRKVLYGDVARRLDSAGMFLVEDETEEQRRFDTHELTHTGPIFGREMRRATGRPAEIEKAVLEGTLTGDLARRLHGRGGPAGARRMGRVFPGECSFAKAEGAEVGYVARFTLPPGSYATVFLRELMEGPRSSDAGGHEKLARPGLPRLVILDRDGVLNEDSDEFVRSAREWEPIAGSMDAVARMSRAGILTAVASNQSGIARRFFGFRQLEEMHAKLRLLLREQGGRLDRILVCPHGPEDDCPCRKPRPGMLLEILEELQVAAADAVFVGDSPRDVEAALAAGVRPLVVLTGKGASNLGRGEFPNGVEVHADLAVAATALLEGPDLGG